MSKKVLIIIIIGLLVLGGGIWYFMTSGTSVDPVTGEREGGLSDVFPIGGDASPSTSTPDQNRTGGSGLPSTESNDDLVKLTDEPVAGASLAFNENNLVRYVTKGQGHVRSVNADGSGDSILLNETVTKVQEVDWSRGGDALILQRLDGSNNIETQYLALANSERTEATRIQLVDPMISYALSPSGDQIALLERTNEGSQLIIRTPQMGAEEVVLQTPLRDMVLEWPTDNMITLTTKPTQEMDGYMYSLSLNSGVLSKELGGIPGLTTNTSPDGSKILYSTSEQGTPFMNIWYRENDVREETGLPVIPSEKCAWANNEVVYCAVPINTRWFYLDWWLQGRFSFVDMIWKFDTNSKESELIVDLSSVGEGWIDAVNLSVDQNETMLVFKDRQNGHLWSYPLDGSVETTTGTSSSSQ